MLGRESYEFAAAIDHLEVRDVISGKGSSHESEAARLLEIQS
jgi:hypothetical protein